MTLKEATQDELTLLSLWETWLDIITAKCDNGENPEREQELFQAYYREKGLRPPTKGSPLSLMFCSFIGGVQLVLKASDIIREGA
jgi:hypothetical protein